jgi:asparagine synthase (glutamine-hydrolysing)
MSQLTSEPVKTFSIGFDEESFDELKYARLAAQTFGTDHHEEILRPQAVELVDELIGVLDEPFGDSSIVPTWMVSKMARREVTVALSGDGGDEPFAGYQSHQVHVRDQNFHQRFPAPLRSLAIGGATAMATVSGQAKLRRVAAALRRANRPLELRFDNVYDKSSRMQLLSAAGKELVGSSRDEAAFGDLSRTQDFPDFLSKILYIDTKMYLANDILVKVDRMSMAHSLEVRSPFVDHHVLELAARMPSHLKLHGGISKYILKKVAEKFVPREIVHREKHGFGIPIAAWFRKDLKALLQDRLLATDDGSRLFNRKRVEFMLAEHSAGRYDWSVALWTLLMFRMWQQRFQ